jgi:hypothetical protein
MQPFFGHLRLSPIAFISKNTASRLRVQPGHVFLRVAKLAGGGCENLIDFETSVIRAIRFQL